MEHNRSASTHYTFSDAHRDHLATIGLYLLAEQYRT
jgi:hypothetical protein